jgi:hypothetical protein
MSKPKRVMAISAQANIRLSPDIIEIIEWRMGVLSAERPGDRVTVSDVIRDLLMRGWQSLEDK